MNSCLGVHAVFGSDYARPRFANDHRESEASTVMRAWLAMTLEGERWLRIEDRYWYWWADYRRKASCALAARELIDCPDGNAHRRLPALPQR